MSKIAQEMQRLADEIFKRKTAPSREDRKDEKKKSQTAVITSVRAAVFKLDKACLCGKCQPAETDEMHEVVPRSKTRGLPPNVRFSTSNCVRLSRRCHAKVTGELGHGKRLTITFADPVEGANGLVTLIWKDGKSKTYRRLQPVS